MANRKNTQYWEENKPVYPLCLCYSQDKGLYMKRFTENEDSEELLYRPQGRVGFVNDRLAIPEHEVENFKRFPNANVKGSIVALLISFVLLAAVLYGVVPGIITVGGWFELFFVNTLGMSFNTGEYIYLFLLVALVIWAIYETQTAKETKGSWIRQNVAFLVQAVVHVQGNVGGVVVHGGHVGT